MISHLLGLLIFVGCGLFGRMPTVRTHVIIGGRVIGIFGLGYGKFSVPSGGLEGKVLEGLVCTDVTLQRHSLLQVSKWVHCGLQTTFLVSVRTFGRRNWGGEGVSSLGSGGVLSACAMREGDEQNAVDPVSRDGCGHGAP